MSSTAEQHTFQAEVNEVLSLVVNSLYSHREVFLRELISNSADALDQLNFRALTEHELLGDDKELRVELVRDDEAGTLTIRDNGVGMTRDELIGKTEMELLRLRSGATPRAKKSKASKASFHT